MLVCQIPPYTVKLYQLVLVYLFQLVGMCVLIQLSKRTKGVCYMRTFLIATIFALVFIYAAVGSYYSECNRFGYCDGIHRIR